MFSIGKLSVILHFLYSLFSPLIVWGSLYFIYIYFFWKVENNNFCATIYNPKSREKLRLYRTKIFAEKNEKINEKKWNDKKNVLFWFFPLVKLTLRECFVTLAEFHSFPSIFHQRHTMCATYCIPKEKMFIVFLLFATVSTHSHRQKCMNATTGIAYSIIHSFSLRSETVHVTSARNTTQNRQKKKRERK